MAYQEVIIRDGGGNRASLNTDGSIVTREVNYNTFGATTILVGLTAMTIISADPMTKKIELYNKGNSNIWLGNTPTIAGGTLGMNFRPLAGSAVWAIDRFATNMYAIIAPGVSGDVVSLGVAKYT